MGVPAVVVTGGIVSFLFSLSIGANDTANSWATSVGSKAISIRNAAITGSILEFCGTVLMGQYVANSIKSLLPPTLFTGEMQLFMICMWSAIAATFVFTMLATYFSMPVSTTHAIVSSVVALCIYTKGITNVSTSLIWTTAISWIASPFVGFSVAFSFFWILKTFVLQSSTPDVWTRRLVPFLYGLVCGSLLFILFLKSPSQLRPNIPIWASFLISLGFGLCIAAIAIVLVFVLKKSPRTDSVDIRNDLEHELETAETGIEFPPSEVLSDAADAELLAHEPLVETDEEVTEDRASTSSLKPNDVGNSEHAHRLKIAELWFGTLMVLTSAVLAFAHGGNDSANAIGPFNAIMQAYELDNAQEVKDDTSMPLWIAVMGGSGISLGLSLWGHLVMETVGHKITSLSFSMGFCADFGTAFSVLLATMMGLPVSTTHISVGSLVGVALVNGRKHTNFRVLYKILVSWAVTIPLSAIFAVIIFWISNAMFTT
eukprot:ANDGO_00900.mRNA.1 Inorganic phosphate transporter 2-1